MRHSRIARLAAETTTAALSATVARRVYDRLVDGPGAARWQRTNHEGAAVTLAQGPAVAVGSACGVAIAPGTPLSARMAGVLAVGGSAALGAIDDLTGATDVKGLRGHLGALRQGQVTTGTLKLVGLGALGLTAGALARGGRGGAVDAVLAGAVVAGGANLANLFDLRPGRASKIFLMASAPMVGDQSSGSVIAGPIGACAGLLPADLAARSMLGDTGANALGAAWGVAVAAGAGRRGLIASTAVLVGLTLASEKVSFSQVIDRTPGLRELDRMGRRPS